MSLNYTGEFELYPGGGYDLYTHLRWIFWWYFKDYTRADELGRSGLLKSYLDRTSKSDWSRS